MKKTRKEKRENRIRKELEELTTQVKDTPDSVAKKIVRDVNEITDKEYQHWKHDYHDSWNEGKQKRQVIIGKAYEQAIVYAYKQEYDFAVAILKTLTELKPNLYFIHLALAYNLLELQQIQQAIQEFNIAQQLGSTRAAQWLNNDHLARSCQAILQDIANQCTTQELVIQKNWKTLKGAQDVLDTMRKTKLKPDENDHKLILDCYRDWLFYADVDLSLDYKWPWASALGIKVGKLTVQTFDNHDIINTCYNQMLWCENYKGK
jgi:tetratricopeptide (TPR) repeat protein